MERLGKLSDTLYSKYIREREGAEIIEDVDGFATYKIMGDQLHVIDIYVEREAGEQRKPGVFKRLMRACTTIALEQKCQFIAGRVYIANPEHPRILMGVLSMGFKVQDIQGHDFAKHMVMVKELKGDQ